MPRTSQLVFRFGHADSVRALAHSPDRKRLATADDLGQVLIWDRETGQRWALRPPSVPLVPAWRDRGARAGGPQGVEHLAFAEGGRVLAVAHWQGVDLYDVGDGALRHSLPGLRGALTADGMELWARLDAATLTRIDPRSGNSTKTVTLVPPPGETRQPEDELRVDARSRRVAQTHDGVLRVWDIDTGALVAEARLGPAEEHPSPAGALFSPDGQSVAAIGAFGVVVVNLATLEPRLVSEERLGHSGPRAWLEEGLYWNGHGLNCWDGERITSHRKGVAGLAAESPLAFGQYDGTVEVSPPASAITAVLELEWARPVFRLFEERYGEADRLPAVRAIAFRPDAVVAIYEDEMVRSWSLATGELIVAMRSPWGVPVGLDTDGTLAVSAGFGNVWVWEVRTGRVVLRIERPNRDGSGKRTSLSGLRLAGGRLAGVESDGGANSVVVWDVATGARRAQVPVAQWPGLRLAPNGTLAIYERGQPLVIVKLLGERKQVPLKAGYIERGSLALSPDGTRLVIYADSHVEEWSLLDAPTLTRRLRPHMDGMTLATTNDGYIASAMSYDPRIWFYDPRSGLCHALPGHRGPSHAVAFSADGRWLATGGGGDVCLRSGRTGRPVANFQVLPGGDRWLTHVPSGAWLGDGAQAFVGDGYAPAPTADHLAVRRALRRARPASAPVS